MKIANSHQGTLFDDIDTIGSLSFSRFCDLIGVQTGPRWADRFGDALGIWAATATMKPIKTLSLFSGVGGLDIAFHDAGFAIQTAVEIDPRFAATLQANAQPGGYLEGIEVICRDIREFHPEPELGIEFIIGGPPCQSFSAAGRRAAGVKGTQDDRGVLFREYVRLLKLLKPKGFLFENVYGITGAEGGKAWESIQIAFADAGYRIFSRLLDAADYGVPQHRERMFIVGVRKGEFLFPAPTHGPDAPEQRDPVSASDAVGCAPVNDHERAATVRGRYGHLLAEVPPGLNYSFFTEEMGHPSPIFAWRSKFSDFLYKADPATPIRTLKAQGGQYTGPFHWENRPFGLGELKRLQTIPDKYVIEGKRQVAMHQIGNSVPPQLARILAVGILSQVFEVRLPAELPTLNVRDELGFRTRKRKLTKVYRAKASEAISDLGVRATNMVEESTHEYHACVSEDFAWRVGAQEAGELTVRCHIDGKEWVFDVTPVIRQNGASPAFEILIDCAPGRPWALGDRQVRLRGFATTRDVFVGLWKAFEAELVRQNIKADLVQLCEYYQYQPRFRCAMTMYGNDDPKWKVLSRVVEGEGTREILKANELAAKWGVRSGEILQLGLWLRTFGYEARNTQTNSQIPSGSFLVPYFFPTLTPLSVQLRKTMVANDEW